MTIKFIPRYVYIFIFLPLVVFLMNDTLGLLDPNLIKYLRGLIHILFSLFLVFVFIVTAERWGKFFHLDILQRCIVVFLLGVLPLISILLNQSDLEAILRIGIMLIFLINIIVLYPNLQNKIPRSGGMIKALVNYYIIFSLLLIGFVTYFYFQSVNPYNRVGYPISPGIFAYYLLIAWLISYVVYKNILLTTLFTFYIIASGSRSAVLIMSFCFLIFASRNKYSKFLLIIFCLMLVVGGIYLFSDMNFLRPYIVGREDVTSGRIEIWWKAIKKITDAKVLFLGTGTEQQVRINKISDPIKGVHNSFLDLSLQYGILFGVLSYLSWFFLFFPNRRKEVRKYFNFKLGLFIVISVKSLITNTFWLNLADGATFISLIMLISYSKSIFIENNIGLMDSREWV